MYIYLFIYLVFNSNIRQCLEKYLLLSVCVWTRSATQQKLSVLKTFRAGPETLKLFFFSHFVLVKKSLNLLNFYKMLSLICDFVILKKKNVTFNVWKSNKKQKRQLEYMLQWAIEAQLCAPNGIKQTGKPLKGTKLQRVHSNTVFKKLFALAG